MIRTIAAAALAVVCVGFQTDAQAQLMRTAVNGGQIEYEVTGSGEPVGVQAIEGDAGRRCAASPSATMSLDAPDLAGSHDDRDPLHELEPAR